MSDGIEKLKQDLEILAVMAAEMKEYLKSDVLFWPMSQGNMPRLTLGGYLMRQYRLLALRHLLSEAEQQQLAQAVKQFNDALVERVVRTEQRIHQELPARLRQWGEYLREARREGGNKAEYYATAVETRAMIAALTAKLELPPFKMDRSLLDQLSLHDRNLRKLWMPGDFIWPQEWTPAYPQAAYWWLYGHPR